jgi:hypothetical protein
MDAEIFVYYNKLMMLQTYKVSMNRAWELNSPTLLMAQLLWWSIEESSYQEFPSEFTF